MKRLGALLLAAVMITGAFWVRDRIDDDNTSGGSSSASAPGILVCATELKAACEALGRRHAEITVRIEDAETTLERLGAPGFDPQAGPDGQRLDAWLVPQPWPEMVAELRQRGGSEPVLDESSPVLARSPMVIAIWNDRRDTLAPRCEGGTITWKCIGQQAGTPWGSTGEQVTWGAVKPSHPAPDRTAAGLLALGEASASWFGSATFASNDFDQDFRNWFGQLERSVPSFPTPPRTPLDDMLSLGPASFDLAGSTEAAAGPSIAGSRYSGQLTILYPAPLTTADVTLAPVTGSQAGGRLMKLIESDEGATALAEAGWRVEGRPPAAGLPDQPLPAESNVPRAGVLQALRTLWIQVVR